MKFEMSKSFPEGMGWRVAVSIIAFFAFIIGIILLLFFYTGNFNVYQNIAIVVGGGAWRRERGEHE